MIGSHLILILKEKKLRRKLKALLHYFLFLISMILAFAWIFQYLMLHVERTRYTFLSSLYWTLTMMTTLGIGDITFASDVGKIFTLVVLMSGLVFLLIILPFLFVRHFFAPWLDARLSVRVWYAPPWEAKDHVILCHHDEVGRKLMQKLALMQIPCFVLEPNEEIARRLLEEDVPVVAGPVDDTKSYEVLRLDKARMVVANRDDKTNANIALTAKELCPSVAITAVVAESVSVDVLTLCGCDPVIAVRHLLGEELARRADGGTVAARVLGAFDDRLLVEFPIRQCGVVGKCFPELRQLLPSMDHIVGSWRGGTVQTLKGDDELTERDVLMAVVTRKQLDALNQHLAACEGHTHPVLIIGGGVVGRASASALRARCVGVNILDDDPSMKDELATLADGVFIGDAANRKILQDAGIMQAPTVIITSREDSTNIYLTVYCRRLNPHIRIIARVSEENNVVALYRAGADLVLSEAALGAEAILAALQERDSLILGEAIELFRLDAPPKLHGKTIVEEEIATGTGLNIIAITTPQGVRHDFAYYEFSDRACVLTAIGSFAARDAFFEAFGERSSRHLTPATSNSVALLPKRKPSSEP